MITVRCSTTATKRRRTTYPSGSRIYRLVWYTVALSTSAICAQAAHDRSTDVTLEHELSAEVTKFAETDRESPPNLCQVLFVGSSSIVNWKKNLSADMAPIPVINRGFGGSHIEYVSRWFNEVVAPYAPRAIVFYAGENDLDAGKSVARVISDFDKFMAIKTTVLGMTPVYFISIKPSKLRFSELNLQTAVNRAVLNRTKTRSDLRYVDVVSPMLKDGRPRDIYLPDNLHMNRAGYLIWARSIRPKLIANNDLDLANCRERNPTAFSRPR